MTNSPTSFVIEAPVPIHLRPTADIAKYFRALKAEHPDLQVCLKTDSLDPTFNQEEDGMECDRPADMMLLGLLTSVASLRTDTERRLRVVLSGPEEIVSSLSERVKNELHALAHTWTNYTIANRTMRDG